MLGNVSLSLQEAFGVSLVGLTVVFLALIALLIAIIIISKIVGGIAANTENKQAQAQAPAQSATAPRKAADNSMDPAKVAAIVGAISMEQRSRIESFRIVSITEKK